MNSPLTGNEMRLVCVRDSISYRKVKCYYDRYYWECPDTKEQFVTTEIDEKHLHQIHGYWLSTRTPRKKENKTEKVLRDIKNKYKSHLADATYVKLTKIINEDRVMILKAKISVIEEIQKKLCQK